MPTKEGEKVDRASVAYILGVLSIVFAFVSPIAGMIFGIIGIIQSNKQGLKKIRRLNVIGLVLSIILFVVSLILVFYSVSNQLTNLFPAL